MEANGIIGYDPYTKYNNPVILVKKPNNRLRIVNDFIKLNEITVDEKYFMPSVNELLNWVAGAPIITRLDCSSYYWQILGHTILKVK